MTLQEEAYHHHISESHCLVAEAFAERDAAQHELRSELMALQLQLREYGVNIPIHESPARRNYQSQSLHQNMADTPRPTEVVTPSPVNHELSSPSPFDNKDDDQPPPGAPAEHPGTATSRYPTIPAAPALAFIVGDRSKTPLCFDYDQHGHGQNGDKCEFRHERIGLTYDSGAGVGNLSDEGQVWNTRPITVVPRTRKNNTRTQRRSQSATPSQDRGRCTHLPDRFPSSSKRTPVSGGGGDGDDPGRGRRLVDDKRDGEARPRPKAKAKGKARLRPAPAPSRRNDR